MDGPWTNYRWYERVCVKKILGLCIKHKEIEHIEVDFDFRKLEDRERFNKDGFDCAVRERP